MQADAGDSNQWSFDWTRTVEKNGGKMEHSFANCAIPFWIALKF
jgi:hypothetical protein